MLTILDMTAKWGCGHFSAAKSHAPTMLTHAHAKAGIIAGVPSKLLADGAKELTVAAMATAAGNVGAVLQTNSPHSPEGNSDVESHIRQSRR